MFSDLLRNVRERHPLIHSITNYVTANDCANLLLACGASPVMADDIDDVKDLAPMCSGLELNLGTLHRDTIPSMYAAAKLAVELNHPVVLDPVGAGATKLRIETALGLMREIPFTVVRGNRSELRALAEGCAGTRGVDADAPDRITPEDLRDDAAFVRNFSRRTGAVIVMTGPVDLVSDAGTVWYIRNGTPLMSRVTGTGCQLSALITAFLAANPGREPEAAAAAVCAMGLCGEIALGRMSEMDGNASYRNYIIDAMYHLTGDQLEKGANYEMRSF